jgi:hypothetical protein
VTDHSVVASTSLSDLETFPRKVMEEIAEGKPVPSWNGVGVASPRERFRCVLRAACCASGLDNMPG